jgi:hypothetical protein
MKWVVVHKKWRTITRPKKWSTKTGKLYITCMFDSDHRGQKSGESNSGMACFLCGIYLHGFRKKQKCITLNTCESEFMSMSQAVQFLVWQVFFLVELRFPLDFPARGYSSTTTGVDSGSLLTLIDQICAAHRPTSKVCSKDAQKARFRTWIYAYPHSL